MMSAAVSRFLERENRKISLKRNFSPFVWGGTRQMVLSCGLLFYQPLRHVLVVVEEITSFLMELREREKNFFIITLGLDSSPPVVHSWLPKKILFFIFVTCAFGFFCVWEKSCWCAAVENRREIRDIFPTEGRKRKDYFSVFGKTASCQEQSKLPNKMREKLLHWERRGEGETKTPQLTSSLFWTNREILQKSIWLIDLFLYFYLSRLLCEVAVLLLLQLLLVLLQVAVVLLQVVRVSVAIGQGVPSQDHDQAGGGVGLQV